VLTGPGATAPTGFDAGIDGKDWQWRALQDLSGEAVRQYDPSDPIGAESTLAEQVGEWTADHVLGPIAGRLAQEAASAGGSVEVEVDVPEGADWILGLPLGIAVIDGTSLAQRGVAWTNLVATDAPGRAPARDRLRVLAVFSVPIGEPVLDLRRERKRLQDLAALTPGVDLRVVQYGVTKERLQEVLAETGGWDVVHFSGHGAPGRLALEDRTGRAEIVDTEQLVGWLLAAGSRLKLVSLSACASATFAVGRTLARLGVDAPATVEAAVPPVGGVAPGPPAGHGLAIDIARRAGSAVVAMRYPVADGFASEFTVALHRAMWADGREAAPALSQAVRLSAPAPPTADAPALSAFTPALFANGPTTVQPPPPQEPDAVATVGPGRMAGFEPEPARFVGRVGPMTRAHAALAPESVQAGVVFHGMAGAGKTACALELAYGQQENFAQMLWWRCPPAGSDPTELTDSLLGLAQQLDLVLGAALGLVAQDPARLRAALPDLTGRLAVGDVLIVIDNAESVIGDGDAWVDPRWQALIEAMAGPGGRSRLVLTTRVPPDPPLPGLTVEAISALSREEAVLLSRQLPHLAALVDQGHGDLLRQVLEVTAGHPKLMELADAQAARPELLTGMLNAAGDIWNQTGIDAARFLTDDTAADDPVLGFAKVVQDWTVKVVTDQDVDTALMAMFLCRCDPADRTAVVVNAVWPGLRRHLDNPPVVAEPGPLTERLAQAALIDIDRSPGRPDRYLIHPVVAATIETGTPDQVADTCDRGLAELWQNQAQAAMKAEQAGRPVGPAILQATRQATVYVLRLKELGYALTDVEQGLIMRDSSPEAVGEAVRLLRRIVDQARGTDLERSALGLLGNTLSGVEPDQAEPILVDVEQKSEAAGDHRYAAIMAGDLVTLYRLAGRYRDALDAADRKAAHARAAGLGPWSTMSNDVQRLEVYRSANDAEHVLTEVRRLVPLLDTLPAGPGPGEPVSAWNVRETLFDEGLWAADTLSSWNEALDFGRRRLASQRQRGAYPTEILVTEFDMARATRHMEGDAVVGPILERCRAALADAKDYVRLAGCEAQMAEILWNTADRRGDAIHSAGQALRFAYIDPIRFNVGYYHFGYGQMLIHSGDPVRGAAHCVAGQMVLGGDGSRSYQGNLVKLARSMAAGVALPATYRDMCGLVDEAPGVHFASLGIDPAAFEQVVAAARSVPAAHL
jgi:hypothetical protein